MSWVVKHKFEIFLVILISLIYFGLRVPNLTLQPVFADEAIYIRWTQVMRAEPTLRFISVSDGKTPLFMWMMIPLFKIFEDPLYAGRFLSILSGFGTLLGVLFLGWKFFDKKVGIWGALLIAITPFMLFFDRMALVDSMLAAFSIWSLNVALLLIRYPRIDLAMALGYLLGGGILVKPPGQFAVFTVPVTILAFNFFSKSSVKSLVRIFALWGLALVITLVIYNILRLGPGFSSINTRNQDYTFTISEISSRPLDPFIPHIRDLSDWFPKLLTPVILLGFFIGALLGLLKKNLNLVVVFLWGLLPVLVECALLKTFTARYVLFAIPPLLLVSAYGINFLSELKPRLDKKLKTVVLLLLVLPWPLYFNYQLLTNPALADLPRNERKGYLEDWTAGYGFEEIARYLINVAKKEGGIVVGTEGSFGTLPDGLQIYLENYVHSAPRESQISIIGGRATISAQLREAALSHPTYYVANRSRFTLLPPGLTLIKEYPKVIGPEIPQDAILFYKVLP